MRQGSSPRRPVVADSQHGEDPTPKTDNPSQRVGNFSEQVWGASMSVVRRRGVRRRGSGSASGRCFLCRSSVCLRCVGCGLAYRSASCCLSGLIGVLDFVDSVSVRSIPLGVYLRGALRHQFPRFLVCGLSVIIDRGLRLVTSSRGEEGPTCVIGDARGWSLRGRETRRGRLPGETPSVLRSSS